MTYMDDFEMESGVRYYCRKVPNLLRAARGAKITDVGGREFIDFMSACGALNYGHNHPFIKAAAVRYLSEDGVIAALDFHTTAKREFIQRFHEQILSRRRLNYKLQFPGPTGANCVEAAIKLARKATGRLPIIAFTNAFHGMSAGALAVTGSREARRASAPYLNGVIRVPYEGYAGAGVKELVRLEIMSADPSGGIEPPAAFIVETVQGEGGLNVASVEWLRKLSEVARRMGALLIVDDIQAGCGRTGTFFSFERARIEPDIVCLAKSISGSGLPMSLLLMKPEHDRWAPGEHNGTFRGNSLAFVTAAAALELWDNGEMSVLHDNSRALSGWIARTAAEFVGHVRPKGIGLMQGLEFERAERAGDVATAAVRRGVIVECCGPRDEVLKIMPPLNIELDVLCSGLDLLAQSIREILGRGRLVELSDESGRYQAHPNAHDDRGDAVVGAELAHAVA